MGAAERAEAAKERRILEEQLAVLSQGQEKAVEEHRQFLLKQEQERDARVERLAKKAGRSIMQQGLLAGWGSCSPQCLQ